jgi:hypothetical protein
MAYIGRGIDKLSNIEKLDTITFDGSSSYSLTKGSVAFTPSSANSLQVSIDGVVQAGNFTVSGSTIDFGTAVASTSTNDFIFHYGTGLITTPADDTVSTAKIQDGAITNAKLATGVGGKILQVQSTAKTDTFTLSTTDTWTDVTGLSVAITPASASNKVLINFSIGSSSASSANARGFKIVRDSTDIAIGDSSGSRVSSTVWVFESSANFSLQSSFTFLDSPSTTSATTYKIQMYANVTSYVNRMSTDSDNDVYGRTASTITAMEVSA